MSSSQKPTIVIVHGGWHDPSCFDQVREPLEASGYRVYVPALPSIGELASTKTASDDVELVHSVVEDCLSQGEDVIVVGHSNGGLKANGALQGLVSKDDVVDRDERRGRVRGLGIIAGLLPPIAKMGAPKQEEKDETPKHLDSERWEFNKADPTMLPKNPTQLFYNDLSPSLAAYWTAKIKPMHTQEMPSGYYEGWRHVPVSYLVCTEDQGIAESQQEGIIEKARAQGGVVFSTKVKSGHSPFLSVPDKVVEWIQKAVEGELV